MTVSPFGEETLLKEAQKWGGGDSATTDDLPGYDYDQIEEYLNAVGGRLDEKYAAFRSGK
ncbi:MAG: hypothetical protein MR913_08910 [Clostridiales bacterium]|nr:hypothetical protein [Clostridiales bacterium]